MTRAGARATAIMFVKFTVFSLGAGIIEFGSFTLLNEVTHLNYWAAYFIALVLSVLYNFTINRRFTFKSANNVPLAMSLVVLFYCFFTPYSLWLGAYLVDGKFPGAGAGLGMNEYLATFIIIIQNFVLEFAWWRCVIFNKSINTRKPKVKDPQPV